MWIRVMVMEGVAQAAVAARVAGVAGPTIALFCGPLECRMGERAALVGFVQIYVIRMPAQVE